MNNFNDNLKKQLMSGEQAIKGSNNVIDPALSWEQYVDQADAPLFVQPSELQSAERANVNTPTIDKSNFMPPAMEEAEELDDQDGAVPIGGTKDIQDIFAQKVAEGYGPDSSNSNVQPEVTIPSPLTPQEKMMAEYRAMQEQDRKALEDARSSDRNLKMGGAIGDALATIVNARGQMNVKAPGVQVQQGAGLGKIADMFATAPDVASDIKSRREDLLAQYKSLGGSQRNELRQLQEPGGKIGLYRINPLNGEKERVGDAPLRMQFRTDPRTGNIIPINPLEHSLEAQKSAEIKGEIKSDTKSVIKSLDPKQKEQVEKARNDFNKSAKDEIDKVNNISQLNRTLEMAKDNKAAANAFGTALAKVYQDGRLSDKDVDLYIKDKQLLQKVRTGYFDAVEGTIDPNKVPEYRELIKALNQGASEALMGKADIFAQQRLSSFIDDPDIAREVVFPINTITKMPSTQQVQPKNTQSNVNKDAYERAIQRAMADNPSRSREQIEAVIKNRK